MAKMNVVVIGGSAGAIGALRILLAKLPSQFPAAICVVVHTSPSGPGMLPAVLSRVGPLPARFPTGGEQLCAGTIYVARPDHHLMLDVNGDLRLGRGAKENGFRPAIDPLFRSAARAFGHRVLGIVLSGALDDGVAGLSIIKNLGGCTAVQDPEDAEIRYLPDEAIRQIEIDQVLPAERMHEIILGFANSVERKPFEGTAGMSEETDKENAYAMGGEFHLPDIRQLGDPSLFTCPDCHGALIKLRSQRPERFRCHVGHAYALDTLRQLAFEQAEQGLWEAIRRLEEYAALSEHAADHAEGKMSLDQQKSLRREAKQARENSVVVRKTAEFGFKPIKAYSAARTKFLSVPEQLHWPPRR
jgi:two-component system, chemotaxis family, protein-glutamate methylesterase/glutaminase